MLGEGPYWSTDQSALYWLDIMDQELHRMDEFGRSHSSVRTSAKVHALAIVSKSRALCTAHAHGLAWLNLTTGALTPVVNPEPDLPTNLLNDARCDRNGRFWFGSISKKREPTGSLYSFTQRTGVVRHAGGLLASNGIVFSPDNRTLYLADTYTGVFAFDFDLDCGAVKDQRLIFPAQSGGQLPDGLTIDQDGCLWVAMALAGKVVRLTPRGAIDGTVEVPSTFVTSCTFGGASLDTLFITSGRAGRPSDELATQPHAGAVFVVRTGARGFAENIFADENISAE